MVPSGTASGRRLSIAATALVLLWCVSASAASTASASINCQVDVNNRVVWTQTHASFSISSTQIATWSASYYNVGTTCGFVPQGAFYLSNTSYAGSEIVLTTSAQTSGTITLNPGTYYIAVDNGYMGPGAYSITYNRTATIAASPATHDFGTLLTGASSAAFTFNVVLTGDLPVNVQSVTSSDPAHFPIQNAQVPHSTPTSFQVRFVPGSAPGTFGSTITVTGTNPDTSVPPAIASVHGIAVAPAPDIACVDESGDIGTADYTVGGSAAGYRSYQNVGTANLIVSAVEVINQTEPVFALNGTPSLDPLAPSQTRSVAIRFTPPASGGERVYTGYLRIESNDADEAVKLCSIKGTAHHPTPHLRVQPDDTLSFQIAPLGFTRTRALKIFNDGDASLTATLQDGWTGFATYAASRPQWSRIPVGLSNTVAPGAQPARFSIAYTPTQVGQHITRVIVASNDPTRPTQDILLSGSAVNGPIVKTVLVLDRTRDMSQALSIRDSTSRIRALARIAARYVQLLRSNRDGAGFVTYGSSTQALLPLATLTDTQRNRAVGALASGATTDAARLLPQGSSNPGAAFLLAKKMLQQASGPHDRDSIVWITNDTGLLDSQLQSAAQSLALSGIRVYLVRLGGGTAVPHTIGFGAFDFDSIDALERFFFSVFLGE